MTIVFNTQIWQQERSIMRIAGLQSYSTHVAVEVVGHQDLRAEYVIPNSLSLEIDLSDIVRMYSTGSFTVTEYDGNTVVATTTISGWQVVGLINPENVLIPETEFALHGVGTLIIPPTKMILPTGAVSVLAESFFLEPKDWFVTGLASFGANKRSITILGDFTLDGGAAKHYTLEQVCLPYVFVEWVSFTGQTRRHIFEIATQSTAVEKSFELLTIDNSYNVRKGREDSLTIRLGGLNRYDLWYYGDVITSSNVRISFNGEDWRAVEVTTKSIELPTTDEGSLNSLEVTLNYARYDAI